MVHGEIDRQLLVPTSLFRRGLFVDGEVGRLFSTAPTSLFRRGLFVEDVVGVIDFSDSRVVLADLSSGAVFIPSNFGVGS